MDYFSNIPFELLHLILGYLNDIELISFINMYDAQNHVLKGLKNRLNWNIIHQVHFNSYNKGQNKNDYEEYIKLLSLERLENEISNIGKDIDKLKSSTYSAEITAETDIEARISGSIGIAQKIDLINKKLIFILHEIKKQSLY